MRNVISGSLVRAIIFISCCAIAGNASAGERGAVTAIAALNAQTSAFIGFESGEVLYCARLSGCKLLQGTPRSAVTAIDIPGTGDNKVVWVGYEDGSIYFCSLTGDCALQRQEESGRPTSERPAGDPRKYK
jgi:hypothetical protein